MTYHTHNGRLYYSYWSGKTRARAESVLDDMFSQSEVSEGENPLIVHKAGRWHVMVPAE